MTQKQVEEYFRMMEEFRSVTWGEHRVTCHFDDRFSLEVKLGKSSTNVLLRSGSKFIKLPFDIFDAICNSQVSIAFLKQSLEKSDRDYRWMCCCCGLRFSTEMECLHHEDQIHVTNCVSGE